MVSGWEMSWRGWEQDVLVFADVVVLALRIQPLEAFETRIWQVLLVLGPTNVLFLQEIDNSRNIRRDLPERVVVHAKVVAADGSNIIGLTRVGNGVVIGQGDTLLLELLEIRWKMI